MKAIDVILKYGWENDECDEAIEEIKTLQQSMKAGMLNYDKQWINISNG